MLNGDEESKMIKPVLDILYLDDYMVAVNKPAGLFVHRSFMDKDEIYFALQLVRDQIGQYVYPVHRLDRPTSGVLLFALTKEVARKLSEAFANKAALGDEFESQDAGVVGESESLTNGDLTMVKTYYALVRGHLNRQVGEITSPIKPIVESDFVKGFIDYPLKEKLDKLGDKNVNSDKPAQSAQTHYQVQYQASLPVKVGKFDNVRYSLVALQPVTGRRHQIRRHLAHLRHPIIGDINYGDNKQNPFFIKHFGFKRLMLIAKSLEFNHPVSNKRIKVTAPFDAQWQHTFAKLQWPLP